MKTKKRWIPLSMPTRFREENTQGTKKKPDRKQNQETAKAEEGKRGTYPEKEDTNRRLLATTRARNWQKISPGRHLVQNPAKNRINSNNATPNDMKPPKDTDQATGTREWKTLKIVFRRMIILETASHMNANIIELVSIGKAQSKKEQEEEKEVILMTWEP
ncbi:unnamed protein product [Lactuca saligna]|uniref:Uncharacterized protein n=1 Tax=Lactuca saligna TaxID=75948 RepID=A0AA35XZL6_LACSI|nr:unnamed protein product [Lactuca saligna]